MNETEQAKEEGTEGREGAPDLGPYPPGEFARIELPGYVAWTGWVAEETFAGAGVLVVRDADWTVRARVHGNAWRQVIPLPVPTERPALTAAPDAEDGEDSGDAWEDDEGGEAY